MSFDASALPDSWAVTPLGDLIVANYGKALVGRDRTSGPFPVVGSGGIVGSHNSALVLEPCVVIGRKGSAGAVHYVDRPSWPIDTTYFVTSANGLNLSYLAYLLRAADLHRLDRSTTIPGLNRDDLYELEVPIAPWSEQIRIVALLDDTFAALEKAEAELKLAAGKQEQRRIALIASALSGELTASWRLSNTVTREETGVELVRASRAESASRQLVRRRGTDEISLDANSLPPLPTSWAWSPLAWLGEIVSGITKGQRYDEGIELVEVPYLRVANVQRGRLDLSEVKYVSATRKQVTELKLEPDDVLFTEGGDRDKLGRGWVWKGELPVCIHQNHIFRFRHFLPRLSSELLSHHGNTFGQGWFQNAGTQTTNLASISQQTLRSFPVPVVPLREQSVILELLSKRLQEIDLERDQIDVAVALTSHQKTSVLHDAVSGRLPTQSPSDSTVKETLRELQQSGMKPLPYSFPVRQVEKVVVAVAKNLYQVLSSATGWMTSEVAFGLAGIGPGSSTADVERLYAELRELDASGLVEFRPIVNESGRKISDDVRLRTDQS